MQNKLICNEHDTCKVASCTHKKRHKLIYSCRSILSCFGKKAQCVKADLYIKPIKADL